MVAPAIFSETFHEIELLTYGRDYTREITIAWSLDPGKTESFGLRVFVDMYNAIYPKPGGCFVLEDFFYR